ncbi:MAG: outer membrane lipoprotein chaperone LolA [Alteromonadaceae bacterium]|nr:outer membrane lipoprotein chaperone LolA [Alteromonadaceae bacterium]
MTRNNPIFLCVFSAFILIDATNALANEVKINKPQSSIVIEQTSVKQSGNIEDKNSDVKNKLIKKLNVVDFFSSDFSQVVQDVNGNALQTSSGSLTVKKPNMVYWNTQEPDESLIVSDGKTLWFFNPFIEQVSAYSLKSAIANTPILLLTSDSPQLWQYYFVTEKDVTEKQVTDINQAVFVIHAKDENSQVKSLELHFNSDKLSSLIILDATGQISTITLNNIDYKNEPKLSLFQFVLPEGVYLDDQR